MPLNGAKVGCDDDSQAHPIVLPTDTGQAQEIVIT